MNSGIDDDVWNDEMSDFESERLVAAQSLTKLENAFSNAGYKHGVDASKTDHMQDGFDQGFELGIQRGKDIGFVLGALIAQRGIRKKLHLSEENIDSLVMRLRAIKHTAAIHGDFAKNAETVEETRHFTEAAVALIREAKETLAKLDSQYK
ncbi:hypothetical protein J3B02_001682 [Coemansia erecta]|uniref:Protein YAE1 n=1 Tax=Coemansia asiatica TaxID=1052880 RepID=A0A9W7XFP0_9FUNG|nr:hypothetical protein LPJ64_005842 [Coemansia asiatica]KAJ2856287.1 hypothetical protein J3B02_001682 [Coemansia erecta]KAJ2883865.1 hypothetical protein FB639_002080 [Coemansia asiatica]